MQKLGSRLLIAIQTRGFCENIREQRVKPESKLGGFCKLFVAPSSARGCNVTTAAMTARRLRQSGHPPRESHLTARTCLHFTPRKAARALLPESGNPRPETEEGREMGAEVAAAMELSAPHGSATPKNRCREDDGDSRSLRYRHLSILYYNLASTADADLPLNERH
jgi:hypothetical protein